MSSAPACSIVVDVRGLFLLVLPLLVACAPDAGPVREWQPTDHDQEDLKANGNQVRQRVESKEDDTKSLAELAWRKNCTNCHGPDGHGDGPQGPMVQAPDITKAELIQKLTDEEITSTIKHGKNRMPAFANLPDRVVAALVARIRAGSSGN